MSYYDSIDDDIVRAKEILAKAPHRPDGSGNQIMWGADVFAAYKLLESFVAEIARLRGELEQLDLWRSGAEDCAKAVDELIAERDQLRAKIRYLEDQIEP